MKPERIALMPDWPARMDAELAADYLGVSPTTLREGAKAGRYPRPVNDGKRVLWAKQQLDRYVAAQFGFGVTGNSWDDL